MTPLSTSDARADFSDVLNRVAYGGERIVLERHGRNVAALVPMRDYDVLEKLGQPEEPLRGRNRTRPPGGKSPLQPAGRLLRDSPVPLLGPVLLAATNEGLCRLSFGRSRAALEDRIHDEAPDALPGDTPVLRRAERELREYLAGRRRKFDVGVDRAAYSTPFPAARSARGDVRDPLWRPRQLRRDRRARGKPRGRARGRWRNGRQPHSDRRAVSPRDRRGWKNRRLFGRDGGDGPAMEARAAEARGLPAGGGVKKSEFDRSPEELRQMGRLAVDAIADHRATLEERPVFGKVGAGSSGSKALLPEGAPFEEVLAFVQEHVLPFPMGNSHPRFYGFINATADPVGIVADLLASGDEPELLGGRPRCHPRRETGCPLARGRGRLSGGRGGNPRLRRLDGELHCARCRSARDDPRQRP